VKTIHFQKFTCSGDTFNTIRARMKEAAWEPGMTRGFGMIGEEVNEIHGALYSERAFTLKRVFDPNKRTEDDEVVRRMTRARFILDFTRGTIGFHERKNMKAVVEALDALPGVTFGLADFKLDVFALLEDLGQHFNGVQIERLGVGNYMEHKHALEADVAFKPSEKNKAWDAARAYAKQLRAFVAKVDLGKKDGKPLRIKLAVNQRAAVSFSEDVTEEMRTFVLGSLQRFDLDKESELESYGIGKTAEELAVDKLRAQTIIKHSKDKNWVSVAQRVVEAIDKQLDLAADSALSKAVRDFRKTAKKLGGVEIVHNGKSVKVG